ncbi:MAG: hypothetical protein RBS99_00100 [Rhodospirillales bacterium]|nr:hypothetical protein [Rhodospirillales bacterium]
MPYLFRLIRNTPVSSLKTFFTRCAVVLQPAVNWTAPERQVVDTLLQAVDAMDDLALARVRNDAERVTKMTDDAGQTALYSVVGNRTNLDTLGNAHDRALWMFLNDATGFLRAEEVRFTDERRRGRMWDGFIGTPNMPLRRDSASVSAFQNAIRQRFSSNHVHVDIFDRQRPTFEGEDCELIQVVVYREGLPDDTLAFDDAGTLVRRPQRPVFEAALTYEPATGVIEVVANDRESREDIVRFMARDLLGIEFQEERLPFRRYDLSVLLHPFDFPTDPADGIAAVEVRQLRLMPLDTVGERLTLECLRKAERTIWDMARDRFGEADPLSGGWVATQAKLSIRFHPTGESRRQRTLPLTITMPHGCNLKDQTEREQLIGERYLRRWGILRDA